MDKLFVLYRYLANSRDEYEPHEKAFKALDAFMEIIKSLEAWSDEYSRKDYLIEHQATAIADGATWSLFFLPTIN